MSVLPQCARERLLWIREEGVIVCPVHASRALRCVTIQSVVPSRWRTAKDVVGDFVEMRAVIGEVAVMRW